MHPFRTGLVALSYLSCLSSPAGEHPVQDGSVRLSADGSGDPIVQRCLAGASGRVARFNDNEPYAAVDPVDSSRIIAIWQTGSGSGSVIQWTRSTDGGRTWAPPRALPINTCAGGPVADATRASDPWATFGPDGRVYLSAIAWRPDPADGPDLVSALVLVASPDGGTSWEAPVAIAIAPNRTIGHDNLAITADPTRPGTLYAATTRAEIPDSTTYYGRLGFTRSVDGGRTWTPIRPITPAANQERIGAPQIVVDPRSGSIFAVYHRRNRAGSTIGVMRSTDRGDSWSEESAAAPHIRGERPVSPITTQRFVLADDIIQAVVSPTTGQLVIAYSDAWRAPQRRHDVSLVWSTNGTSWSPPLAISDSSVETAWLPAIAATRDGTIGVSYYSADFARPQSQVRVMLQRFRGSGNGLVPFERTELDRASFAWPGDYQGLVPAGSRLLAVYGKDHDIFAQLR